MRPIFQALSQSPFQVLPSRFLVLGMFSYLALEFVAAMVLESRFGQGLDIQLVQYVTRISELLIILLLVSKFKIFESFGLKLPDKDSLKIFTLLAVASILMAAVVFAVFPAWLGYISLPSWLYGTSGLLLMVVLAPVVEELVYRGLLYRMLREQWGVASSVAISSILFSLVHHGLIVSPQLVGGIIFALAFEWSRSLWVSIGLHMGANAAVYTLVLVNSRL